jgi:arylsulfatase
MINYIDRNKDDKPFFGYLAFTAPHDPLHLPDEWLDKYKGRYDQGYDALRTERLARMKKLGIESKDVELSHRLPMIPEWDTMTGDQRRMEARRMELHAGMVENIDHHLGRLVRYLKETGKYDNTLIFFFSDNGAAATEFHQYPDTDKAWVEKNSDNRFENLGKRGSRVNIGFNWAVSSNTPLRYFKAVHAEGGIRVPCIITGSDIKKTGQIDSAFAHVMDIAPTLLDAAGVSHPSQFQGRKVLPMMGKSMLPFLEGKADFVRDDSEAVGWELFGRRAIRQGHWKAIWLDSPLGTDDWQLFDIEADPTERNDLAESNKDKLNDLILLWEQYADDTGVILPSATMELAD